MIPYTKEIKDQVFNLINQGYSHRQISEALGISVGGVSSIRNSVDDEYKPVREIPTAGHNLPVGKHELEFDASGLPDPFPESFEPFTVDNSGQWLVISDIHIPYHDRTTLELALKEAKRRRVVGVILNGDILDCHELSDHDKDPRAPRYVEELQTGKQFLGWLRKQLPNARIIYKQGNHEDRLERYLIRKAPVFFGLEAVTTPALLGLNQHGIEWVADKRIIMLGKLNVIHGHEYRGGVSSPVNPARGLYLKARSVAMAGHHHQTSEHHAKDIRGRAEAAWSLGCACYLQPAYMRFNGWNHGFAFTDLYEDGDFSVENKRVLNGKIV